MSERKSWDIQPSRRSPSSRSSSTRPTPQPVPVRAAPPRAPQARPTPQQTRRLAPPARKPVAEKPQPIRSHRTEKIPQGKEREPLKERRRRARRRLQVLFSVIFVLIIIDAFICVWLPAFRIQHVDAAGTDATQLQATAQQSLSGTLDYILPRNSIFFFPEDALRAGILSQYPDISAVSISRTSFSSIAIDSVPRDAALMWCGSTYTSSSGNTITTASENVSADASSTDSSSTTPDTLSPSISAQQTPTCYNADAEGFIFSAVSPANDPASSSDTLHVYGALAGSNTNPIGSTIADSSNISNALSFVKAIKSLGVPIVALVLRGDEADLYAQSGTRITYVLGQEHDAAQLAASAFPSMNLNDGSLKYVDLRFAGKVYFKKVGAGSEDSSNGSQ